MAEKNEKPTDADVGAAFLAWYAEKLREFPDGLVTQAQAAKMLGIGRMSVNRLVARGYLRAVYFPKAPQIEGFSVDEDDSTWLKLKAWFGKWVAKVEMPEACFVVFGDVVEMWLKGDAAKKCRLQWLELIRGYRSKQENVREAILIADARADQVQAESLIASWRLQGAKDMAPLGRQKVYMHDDLLAWFDDQATKVDLTRNQLVFFALKQWSAAVQGKKQDIRIPHELEVSHIQYDTKTVVMEQCNLGVKAMWVRAVDEFGGDLGTYGSTGLRLDGRVD